MNRRTLLSHAWKTTALVLLSMTLLVVFLQTGKRLLLEMSIPFYGDATTYLSAGRAIVNGLIPYRDFLEIKPPGIFFFTAISYALTGDERLAVFLRFATLLGTPLLIIGAAFLLSRNLPRFRRSLILLLAGIFAIQLLQHVMMKAGGLQTEAFGVFFATAFVLCSALWKKERFLRTISLAILLAASIGLKEPFLISLAAAAILLARKPADVLHNFLFPFLLAAAGGALLFLFLGYLGPYFHIYLPAIFGDRININGEVPLFLRGSHIFVMFDDLTRYHSTIRWTGYAILILFFFFPLLRHPQQRLRLSSLLPPLALLGTCFWMEVYYELFPMIKTLPLLQALHVLPQVLPSKIFSLLILSGITTVAAFSILALRERELFHSTLIALAAGYLTVFATQIANGMAHHYLFAFPVYVALFVVFLQAVRNSWDSSSTRALTAVIGVLLFLAIIGNANREYSSAEQRFQSYDGEMQKGRKAAALIQPILDRCNLPYFNVICGNFVSFVRQSPVDLGWPETRTLTEHPSPPMQERFFADIARTQLLFLPTNTAISDERLVEEIKTHFSADPLPCASGLPLPEGIVMFHRTSSDK